MKIAVILPAAGRSRRFASAGSKLEASLSGRAVMLRAVELFSGRAAVEQIIIAAPPDEMDTFKFKWGDKLGLLGGTIVAGGTVERWETVRNALAALNDDITHVAVHDAARPVTDPAMIDRVFEAAEKHDAVIPAVQVSSTLKRIDAEPLPDEQEADPLDAILGSAGKKTLDAYRVVETVPRDGLWMVQTPQMFDRKLLQRAYDQIESGQVDASNITDDAGLIEALGEQVVAVNGDALNVKITVPEDLKFAEMVQSLRTGQAACDALGPKRKHATWAEMDDD
ncbi:2-C-methyl-D-erythritol 4-phosphate cytidylyltransferase [Planctomycetales bacterium ZRK34]|nr:2-C-methyl-D-erythritol 4-phosphate cytidylyltransferase [Planctomycetales bacterium ZRK34]